jgi:hypothetical protein
VCHERLGWSLNMPVSLLPRPQPSGLCRYTILAINSLVTSAHDMVQTLGLVPPYCHCHVTTECTSATICRM